MLKTLALTGCLGLALAAPLAAETYTDPDRAWWTGFLDAIDGRAPDLEALARQDPDYLAADEFTRDAVLGRSVYEVDVLAGARNRALRMASGEFVTFLDADDAFMPAAISRMVAERERPMDWAACSCVRPNSSSSSSASAACIPPARWSS